MGICKHLLKSSRHNLALLPLFAFTLLILAAPAVSAQDEIIRICPSAVIEPRTATFEPGGIILTAFDRTAIWVYEIDTRRRYPLPETRPCDGNCNLSPDSQWLTYLNSATYAVNRMRLTGTQRSLVSTSASDVEWWSPTTFLVWTPGHNAFLVPDGSNTREYLPANSVESVQPGGRWAVRVAPNGNDFERFLVDLGADDPQQALSEQVSLGNEIDYFSAAAWSPDGEYLAYVAPIYHEDAGLAGSEIFGIQPGSDSPQRWTMLSDLYGAIRINGLSPGELSWSPDGSKIAFWVTGIDAAEPSRTLGGSIIHILDRASGAVTSYCGYTTTEHTPNPPRLRWSPEGSHIAFAGVSSDEEQGYLLLALNVETGIFTALSDGVYPALGQPNVLAWGLAPA